MKSWILSRTRLRGEIRGIRVKIIQQREELLSLRNVWRERLVTLLVTSPGDVKQIAKFYFRVAEQLKILSDIQRELQLLDYDLENWPTSALCKKTRECLDYIHSTDTTSVKAFYFSQDSYFKTSRPLIDTEWGVFSSLERFYERLVGPPKYEDTGFPPPYCERSDTTSV
jgi:hypothetical protein